MHPTLDKIVTAAKVHLDAAAKSAARLDTHKLAWGGLALAAITFLAVNLFASTAFRGVKMDLTRDGLYTISDGTRKALKAIDEPIDVRVYFSKRLGDAAPTYAKNFERVRSLLERYRDISGGKLQVSFLDPEPFSDAEDRAVAAGLRGIRLNQEGDQGYFGLVGTNATDNEASIGFFAADRERFLEYDVTKLVHTLANPKKRVIGMISSIPLDGAMPAMMRMGAQPTPPQMVMEQIREFFEVKTLEKQPQGDPGRHRRADAGAAGGAHPRCHLRHRPVRARRRQGAGVHRSDGRDRRARQPDGHARHAAQHRRDGEAAQEPGASPTIPRRSRPTSAYARRVQFGGGRGASVTDYVVWLSLDRNALDQRDVLSARHRAAQPRLGRQPREGGRRHLRGRRRSSPPATRPCRSAPTASARVPDAVGLLRSYKPEGKLVLAARVSGKASSAFADGAPKAAEAKKDEPADAGRQGGAQEGAAKGNGARPARRRAPRRPASRRCRPSRISRPATINVIVIADTDLLNDQFWVEVRDFLGQQVAIPNAHNSAFVLAALENLSGSDALISLRGRGISDRPFELVDRLRRDSERRFRDKEFALTAKLKEVQDQLSKLEKAGEGESLVLSDKDRAAIEKFRGEMLVTRRELREVKRELRKDIDQLDGMLKFVNIAAVPLLIGVGGVGWAAYRRRRKPDAAPTADK